MSEPMNYRIKMADLLKHMVPDPTGKPGSRRIPKGPEGFIAVVASSDGPVLSHRNWHEIETTVENGLMVKEATMIKDIVQSPDAESVICQVQTLKVVVGENGMPTNW